MLAGLTRLSLRHRGLTLGLGFALVLAGVLSWLQLPIDAFPEIAPTQAKIILKSPGMTPEEIEQRIVRPLELELLSIPYKRIVRSISKYGISDITIDFDDGVDLYWARQQVAERLAVAWRDLPPGISGGLAPLATPLSDVLMFTLEGEAFSLAEKRRLLDTVIRPALRTLPGVAEVNALGGVVQTFEVVPDLARMAALGVSMADLRAAVQLNNANDGAGRLTAGEEAVLVRVEGAVRTLDDLRRLRLPSARPEQTVFLSDCATVRLGQLARLGAVTRDGEGETVQGIVMANRGANARALVEAASARLGEVQTRLPAGLEIRIFYNRGELVSRATNTVLRALGEAALLVCLVLYVFLGNLRAALVVAIALPLSLLATGLLMRALGLTANLMSLGGLAIALGLLVDAAVVVVENIESNLLTAPSLSTVQRIGLAVEQVAKPVAAGILIIAVVFLPLLTLEGLEGKLFAPVAWSIVMALAASLLISLTLVPVLAGVLLRSKPKGVAKAAPEDVARGARKDVPEDATKDAQTERSIGSSQHATRSPLAAPLELAEMAALSGLQRSYQRLSDVCWRHPRACFGTALAALACALGVYTQLGKTFLPVLDEGDILLQVYKLASISLEASTATDTRIQQAILAQVPEVTSIVARVGTDEIGLDPMGLNETDTYLRLRPREQWRGDKEQIVERLRTVLAGFPGVNYAFSQPIEMRVDEMLTGARGDLVIKVFAQDLSDMQQAAQKIATAVRQVPGAAEVIAPKAEGQRFLSVAIQRDRASDAGFSVEALQSALKAQLEGETLGYVVQGLARIPLTLRGGEQARENLHAFADLRLVAPSGRPWAIGSLADIREVEGPIQIDHEQGLRVAKVQVSVQGRDLSGFVEQAQGAVAALALGPQIRLEWGGQFQNQQRASARLALVIPAALVLIFIILSLSFGSARQATVILLNVPFALVGGVFALALSGEYLSVPASVGMIALLGIAVLNGVVMVTHFNERLSAGEPIALAVRRGSLRRLRPVLMTAVITALGMLPLLFASGPGAEIQRPLAIVVSGGILTSTLLTLLLLPLLFERFGTSKRGRLDDVDAP